MKKFRLPVAMKRLYSMYEHEAIGEDYLPQRVLIDIMKNCRIVPKIITASRFNYTCYWYARQKEGYNME